MSTSTTTTATATATTTTTTQKKQPFRGEGPLPIAERISQPASIFPALYSYHIVGSPAFDQPLNHQEAFIFRQYEKYRAAWYNIFSMQYLENWKMPYDPTNMNPWNWDRLTCFSGLTFAASAAVDYVKRGHPFHFAAHLAAAALFPLSAATISHPQTRDAGYFSSMALCALTGTYAFVRGNLHPTRTPASFVIMFMFTLPLAAIHYERLMQFKKEQDNLGGVRPSIRIYNPKLLVDYIEDLNEQDRMAALEKRGSQQQQVDTKQAKTSQQLQQQQRRRIISKYTHKEDDE